MEQIPDFNEPKYILGWWLSDEQAETIIFASRLIASDIQAGRYPTTDLNPLLVEEGIDGLKQFTAELDNGSRVIEQHHKLALEEFILPYLAGLFTSVDSLEMLNLRARVAGVDATEFAVHGNRARAILENVHSQDTE